MHSAIIQLMTPDKSKEDLLKDSDLYDDPIVLMRSDYFNEILNEEERKEIIKNALPKIFKDIAEVDLENETVTITDFAQAQKVFSDWKQKTLQELAEKNPSMYEIKSKLMNYKNFDELFYVNLCQNSSRFMEDFVEGHYGNTLKVGAVFDYHF